MNAEYERIGFKIAQIGKRLWLQHMAAGIDGNISVRLDHSHIMITCSGKSLGLLRTNDMVIYDLSNAIIQQDNKPSSELPLHIACLLANPKATTVVHAHPPYSTALGVISNGVLFPVFTNTVLQFGMIPVVPYETPASDDFAESAARYVKMGFRAMIFEHHGALAIGNSLDEAYFTFEEMEHLARTYLISISAGIPRCLSRRKIDALLQLRKRFGIEAPQPKMPNFFLSSRFEFLRMIGYWLRSYHH